ncbi:hypothetical protein G6011_06497 [Alternaria panax]|uniref:Erythromycin biosynthesis protein CIII-like C-terminal domain-containing protein n=1 Tax=Alternaria panax TaxID=48097 RepID=A0AAD4I9T0_9PLEO|nr:hypothetical protein G6011_06497 [Alternaria panax]
MTELIFEAMKKIAGGRRVLISKGWGGVGAGEIHVPDNIFMLGNVPHDWLFKHVSCVVHHGGAGITAAGIAAGKSANLLVPFFGNQPFWDAMIARAGAGPDSIPYKQLTSDKLASAINFCLKPESLNRAKDLAGRIAAERGSDMGAQSFHQYLEAGRLRYTLAPSRAAMCPSLRTSSLESSSKSTRKDCDMMRPTGLRASRGFGRIVEEGDDTVRPQEKVSDSKSGMKAVGREFGFGWYDGVTGLFTQPWKGAQKEGTSGFFKRIGKGIGGSMAKPGAALFGIPSHMMKGVHKEVQKLFGNNVKTYIITSRTAQGYHEWLQSFDAGKEDVIYWWKMIQKKYLKKKHAADDMVQDMLDAQRERKTNDSETDQNHAVAASSVQSVDTPTQNSGIAALGTDSSQRHIRATQTGLDESLGAAEINETIRQLVLGTSRGDAEEDSSVEHARMQLAREALVRRHFSHVVSPVHIGRMRSSLFVV